MQIRRVVGKLSSIIVVNVHFNPILFNWLNGSNTSIAYGLGLKLMLELTRDGEDKEIFVGDVNVPSVLHFLCGNEYDVVISDLFDFVE